MDNPEHDRQFCKRSSSSPHDEPYHPTQQQAPDVHPQRRKLQLSLDEEDDDSLPLTRSIKAARVAKAGQERVTIAAREVRVT